MRFPARGLYAITQTDNKSGDTIINEVEAAIIGGAVIVQYRDKNPADSHFLARELVKICHRHNVPLIINDDVELAVRTRWKRGIERNAFAFAAGLKAQTNEAVAP